MVESFAKGDNYFLRPMGFVLLLSYYCNANQSHLLLKKTYDAMKDEEDKATHLP